MGRYPPIRRAEIAGRWLGERVHRLLHHNGRVTRTGGVPVVIEVALWAVGIAAVGLLVLLAFWLVAVVALAWIAFKVIRIGARSGHFTWQPTDPEDHRQSVFYHPLSHNDDRDPRFPDPRFGDK